MVTPSPPTVHLTAIKNVTDRQVGGKIVSIDETH